MQPAGLINGAYNVTKIAGRIQVENLQPNCKWNKSKGTGFLVDAVRRILPGTELTASYGNKTRDIMFGVEKQGQKKRVLQDKIPGPEQKRVRSDEKRKAISNEAKRLIDNTSYAQLKSQRKTTVTRRS